MTHFSVGATKFSKGFEKTAMSTSMSIHKQGARIRDNIEPEKSPTKVNSSVTQGLGVAKTTSAGALKVSRVMGKREETFTNLNFAFER